MIKDALRAAITRYRELVLPNEYAERVLDRLTPPADADADGDYFALVLPAFKEVSQDWWPTVLYACARGYQEQRRSKDIVEQSEAINKAAAKADKALAVVESFMGQLARSYYKSPEDALAFPLADRSHLIDPTIGKGPPRPGPERAAIEVLRARITLARREANTKKQSLSHKVKGVAEARRAAGIGWIKAAIRLSAPKARNWRKLVADLATAVLDDTDDGVTEDMVTSAKTPREWQAKARAHFAPEKT